jgi:hypothetical protein
MFGSIGLALGALSTVSSLIDSTVSSIGQAAKDAPAQTFSAGPASVVANAVGAVGRLAGRARRPLLQPPRQRSEQMRQQIDRKLRQREE